MKKFPRFVAALIAAGLHLPAYAQDHDHLETGAASTAQGAPLLFVNGGIFSTNYNYVKTLVSTNSGRFAGHYVNSLTLTALAQLPANGGPETGAAALGACIHAELQTVEGPSGGVFSFWEANATSPTVSLASGATGTNTWPVSQNDGTAGTDPYGHIHGRRFTATKPGLYAVTFRLLDRSTAGTGGGPIHSPSEPLTIYFQAGTTIRSLAFDGATSVITFGATAGSNWQTQYSDEPGATDWLDLGEPVPGNDLFVDVADPAPNSSHRLYRIKRVP